MNKKIMNTKRALLEALCCLSAEKNIDDISVTELCRKADINRTTFYKYYNVPADVLVDYIERSFAEAFDDGAELTTYERMLKMCRQYRQEKKIIDMFLSTKRNMQPIIERAIPHNDNHSIADSSKIYLISGGVASLEVQWAKQGMKESPEEIATLLAKYIDLVYYKLDV